MANLVVFEGPDKVGKETQSKMLLESLQNDMYKAVRVEVPSRSCPRTHKLIYKMLHDGSAKRHPNAFQFVQFLNKWLFQMNHLPKLLKENDVVILDRWSLSAVIYGGATGVNKRFNMFLFNRLKKPTITLVLHGRSFRRSTTTDDSYEKDSDLQTTVARAYYEWAMKHSDSHVLIPNHLNRDEIHKDIMISLAMAGAY